MVSLIVHNSHPHDHFIPIARLDSETMKAIGAVEGDILEIIGKRRAVAKCKLLDKDEATSNPNSVWLTNTVRNNAEVQLGATVEVRKAKRIADAQRVVMTSSHTNEITKNIANLGITQHLPAMLAGSPVLPGDYVVTHQPMGGMRIVFEVLKVEVISSGTGQDTPDETMPTIITSTTAIEIEQNHNQRGAEGQRRRGYPVFWVSIQDAILKTDDNVFLVMKFWGLHSEGHYSGELEKKITLETDIQNLVISYTEAAQKEVDAINEKARTEKVSANEVKNRILQKWISI